MRLFSFTLKYILKQPQTFKKTQMFREQKSERLFLFPLLCYTESKAKDGGRSPEKVATAGKMRTEKIFRTATARTKEEKGWLEGSAGSPSVRRAIIC